MKQDKKSKKAFVNPIDPDKIASNPHLLPYAHTVGGAVIKPEDTGKLKGRALSAMNQQTDMQLSQIYEQMQFLAAQAQKNSSQKNHFGLHLSNRIALRAADQSCLSLVPQSG